MWVGELGLEQTWKPQMCSTLRQRLWYSSKHSEIDCILLLYNTHTHTHTHKDMVNYRVYANRIQKITNLTLVQFTGNGRHLLQ